MKRVITYPLFLIEVFVLFFFVHEVCAYDGNREKGLRLYKKKCAWCHGQKGMGDGPASPFLRPLPRDFSSGLYKFVTSNFIKTPLPLDKDIFRVISQGLPGTAMPGWKDVLSENDIHDLVIALKSFSPLFDSTGKVEEFPLESMVPFSPKSAKYGGEVFKQARG
ncbi:MAG: c-type cytochrome, partial [Nitrospinota bacterium]